MIAEEREDGATHPSGEQCCRSKSTAQNAEPNFSSTTQSTRKTIAARAPK